MEASPRALGLDPVKSTFQTSLLRIVRSARSRSGGSSVEPLSLSSHAGHPVSRVFVIAPAKQLSNRESSRKRVSRDRLKCSDIVVAQLLPTFPLTLNRNETERFRFNSARKAFQPANACNDSHTTFHRSGLAPLIVGASVNLSLRVVCGVQFMRCTAAFKSSNGYLWLHNRFLAARTFQIHLGYPLPVTLEESLHTGEFKSFSAPDPAASFWPEDIWSLQSY